MFPSATLRPPARRQGGERPEVSRVATRLRSAHTGRTVSAKPTCRKQPDAFPGDAARARRRHPGCRRGPHLPRFPPAPQVRPPTCPASSPCCCGNRTPSSWPCSSCFLASGAWPTPSGRRRTAVGAQHRDIPARAPNLGSRGDLVRVRTRRLGGPGETWRLASRESRAGSQADVTDVKCFL